MRPCWTGWAAYLQVYLGQGGSRSLVIALLSRGGGVKLGAHTRSRSGGRGLDGEGGVTYRFAVVGGQGPRPSCSHPAGERGGGGGWGKGCCATGAGVRAGEVCTRKEPEGGKPGRGAYL